MSASAVREQFAKLMPPLSKLALRIRQGVDATVTEFAKFEGKITDRVDCIDFEQRRRHVEMALNFRGLPLLDKHEHELSGRNGEPVKMIIKWKGEKPEWAP